MELKTIYEILKLNTTDKKYNDLVNNTLLDIAMDKLVIYHEFNSNYGIELTDDQLILIFNSYDNSDSENIKVYMKIVNDFLKENRLHLQDRYDKKEFFEALTRETFSEYMHNWFECNGY